MCSHYIVVEELVLVDVELDVELDVLVVDELVLVVVDVEELVDV